MNDQVKKVAHNMLAGANKRGIKDVKVVVGQSRNVSVTYRKGRPDKVTESSRRQVTVTLYDNGRYSSSSSNDFRPDQMDLFLDNAVAMTRAMEPDPFRELTDPSLYANRQKIDLDLVDPKVVDFDATWQNQLALQAEQAALGAGGALAISAEANMETQSAISYQLHSNGFEGLERGTQAWLYAEISLKDKGEKRPSGWSISGGRFVDELDDAATVGRAATDRAKLKLGTGRISTRKCPMVVENRAVGRLLGGLLSATSGRALQQKRSFLAGMEDMAVGSPLLTIKDEPFIKRGLGSRLFDSEGISARPFFVMENGVFKNYFIDTYYGKKLKKAPTTGSSSNLVIPVGDKGLADLVKEVNDGILVRGFIGGNTNSTTGDFSLGVWGTLIENGQLTNAVSELNISGNHKDLWHHLTAVGNDPWPYSRNRVPSLVFDEIQFSGS